MKRRKLIILSSIILILSSIIHICLTLCKKDESVSLGTVEYYPKFLWVESNTTPVTKTFDFEFSPDAKDDNSFAEFQFVDNEGKPISTNVMQVTIDGKEIANNKFRINSDVSSTEFTFKFSPNAEKGKYQGYLKLVGHTLDRLDSQPLTSGQQVDAFQWTINYDKRMNPLAKVLIWLGFLIMTFLLLWLFILKPIFYPKFKSIKKGVYLKNCPPITINFKGARLVVLDNKPHKQSNWDKIFKGKIIYKQHQALLTQITMKPHRRGIMVVADTSKYIVTPNPMPRIGSAIMNDLINRTNIEIK